MIIYLNASDNNEIEVSLKNGEQVFASKKIPAARMQAEKLLPAVENILRKNKLKLKDVELIEVKNEGGSFTSVRIGVATANALGFALGIPVQGTVGEVKKIGDISIVEPVYDREPDIGNAKC
jgi:tRNA A37 threonylcarbamoyladenosine modification protein TsaB